MFRLAIKQWSITIGLIWALLVISVSSTVAAQENIMPKWQERIKYFSQEAREALSWDIKLSQEAMQVLSAWENYLIAYLEWNKAKRGKSKEEHSLRLKLSSSKWKYYDAWDVWDKKMRKLESETYRAYQKNHDLLISRCADYEFEKKYIRTDGIVIKKLEATFINMTDSWKRVFPKSSDGSDWLSQLFFKLDRGADPPGDFFEYLSFMQEAELKLREAELYILQSLNQAIKDVLAGRKARYFIGKDLEKVAEIKIKQNPLTKQPYKGVVADGASYLEISIYLPGVAEVQISKPALGKFKVLKGTKWTEVSQGELIPLDSEGKAKIRYIPPDYLQKAELTETLTISSKNDGHVQIWIAKVPLTFTYFSQDNQKIERTLDVIVCRPPVMLVHGFTGDLTTWRALKEYLQKKEKFHSVNRDYGGTPKSTISDLGKILLANIKEQKDLYSQANIKITKVDVVAHSMGGLITRSYLQGLSGDYRGDVRKLIMVGTPNHGVPCYDETAGRVASWWFNYRHWTTLDDLDNESLFLAVLNLGEATGQHLIPDVQYANLIGRRFNFWIDDDGMPQKWYDNHDGVIYNASSHLNGVMEYRFDAYLHSPAAPGDGQINRVLTTDQIIWNKIVELLLKDIPRAPLSSTRIQILRGEDEVYVKSSGKGQQAVKKYPLKVRPSDTIHTGEGRVIIGLYLNNSLWGIIAMRENTRLSVEYVSPKEIIVKMEAGSARFKSLLSGKTAYFEVITGEEGTKWYDFRPRGVFRSRGTDFVIEAGESPKAYVLEGRISVEAFSPDGEKHFMPALEPLQAVVVQPTGAIQNLKARPEPWWETPFYEVKLTPTSGTIADFDDFKWQDEWHDPQGNTYTYRMAVDIFSEVEAARYQIAITLDPKSFNYPHAQPEGRDIRFVAESEGKLFELPYWIEKWNPKGESKVWVKVPLIRDTVRVYLYYGNSEVSSKSSGKDVFESFDDFSEFADWSVYGNKPTVATMEGRKVIEMRGWSEIVHALKLDQSNYAFESLSKLTSGMEAYMPFLGFGISDRSWDEDNAYQFGYNVWAARYVDNIRVFKDGSQKIKVAGDPAYSGRSGWVRSRFTVYNGKLTQVIHDETKGTQKITARDTHWIENTPKEVGIIVWDGASYAIDWLFVRNYLEPEPTYSLGSEEKRPVEEPLEPAGIISLIRACQESISEQLEMIKQMKREIELLKARIDQLEERIEELSKRELPRQVINFQGVWDTDWGEMRLTQSGASVSGNYTHNKGKITGIVKGNVLTGKWSEAPSYSEPHDAGDVELELSEDGNSFSGRWRYGSSGEWDGVWTGRRVDKG